MESQLPQKWDTRFELKPGTWVFVPTEASRELGYTIKKLVEERWRAPKNYFHLTSGGHVQAIKSHVESKYFAHLDIQNFFGQVSASRITRWLKPLVGYDRAREFSKASTVAHPIDGGTMLPFGFVQSPVLASLCLFHSSLGRCLRVLPVLLGVKVSVYVDDIVLSSPREEDLREAVRMVDDYAARSGFPINPDKREGPAIGVTAFNIALAHRSLCIEDERWKRFLSAFHGTDSEFVRRGIQSYVLSVSPEQAKLLTHEK